VELYLHSPNTPSWRGARGSTGTTLLTLLNGVLLKVVDHLGRYILVFY
jgi:hypothetical protein